MLHSQRRRLLPLLLLVLAVGSALSPAAAQQQGYGQTIDGASGSGGSAAGLGPSMGKGNSVLDAANPIDLMNRIRRSQALDDATSPGDAVDQALREYQSQPLGTPSQAVKGP